MFTRESTISALISLATEALLAILKKTKDYIFAADSRPILGLPPCGELRGHNLCSRVHGRL